MPAPARFRTHLVPDVLAYLRERGGDGAAALRRAGLPADAGERPHLDLSLSDLGRFLEGAAQEAGDGALGLHVGQRLGRRTWDVLQLACRSSPTLGEALLRIPRLLPLFNDAVEIDVETGAEWRVSHRIAGHPEGMSRHGNELWLATLLCRAREDTGAALRPTRCWFGHGAPAELGPLRALVGEARLDFGAGSTGLALPAEDMARPLRGADPVLVAVLDRLSAEALRGQGLRRGTAAQVYRQIRQGLDGAVPEVGPIARRLGLSARSLQRRLDEEGTSYRELVDQVRRDLARLYLAQGASRDDVALRLGYAETASLTRALSRWSRPTRR